MKEKLKNLAGQLKTELEVYQLVLRHPTAPWVPRALLGLALGYLLVI